MKLHLFANKTKQPVQLIAIFALAMPALLTTLSLNQLLYESAFPYIMQWLGSPIAIALTGLFGIVLGYLIQQKLEPHHWITYGTSLLPLWLNLAWLFGSNITPVKSWLILGASLWLTTYFILHIVRPNLFQHVLPNLLWLFAGILPIYLLTTPATVGMADTFEFQVVTPQLGIVHPTGYPLYLLLGKFLTSLIPNFRSFAWQLNLMTMLYGLGTLSLLYIIVYTLWNDHRPALMSAVVFGVTPTFWSQAIEAEVYTLHTFIITAALLIMLKVLVQDKKQWLWSLPLLVGIGLTNHLTTVFLIPPIAITFWLSRSYWQSKSFIFWLKLILLGALPLLLYAYLPIRWLAVNNEPMGVGRFFNWVIGGRFAGALQWLAWWQDPTRYVVVGRLFMAEWGIMGLTFALLGWWGLLRTQRRAGIILLVTWLGFTFYCLNYYVPDLHVFLLPSQIIIAIGWGSASIYLLRHLCRLQPTSSYWQPLLMAILILMSSLDLPDLEERWQSFDPTSRKLLTQWGTSVLNLPIPENAGILADSEKIAPLYYLQKAENIRTDLDIMVLPDEASYRAELDNRLAQGQPMYLARFLPALAGQYHLRSFGPLLEVSPNPLTTLPSSVTPTDLNIAGIDLIGIQLDWQSPYDGNQTAFTLYWQSQAPLTNNHFLYTRWHSPQYTSPPMPTAGQHPANNYYPTVAWQVGEIVPDFHQIPRPAFMNPENLQLQVAWGDPFAPTETLMWHTIATMPNTPNNTPTPPHFTPDQPLQVQVGNIALTGITYPQQHRPQTPLTLILQGTVLAPDTIQLSLHNDITTTQTSISFAAPYDPFTQQVTFTPNLPNGTYTLSVEGQGTCGWGQINHTRCRLGEITIDGVTIPDKATNFADKIALLHVELETMLTPGGQLPLTLHWQALSPLAQDYTLFIQVLDAQDRIVGQIDTYPLQGTYPTSQWQVGDTLTDSYNIQLSPEMPAGDYHIYLGWYLLSTLERLPILNANGVTIDDKHRIPNLSVQE